MPTTTGNHPTTYPAENATGWFATWESYAQAISDYLDDLGTTTIDQINDSNDNEMIVFNTAASAVNYFDFTNSATGSGVAIAAAGTDTNIDLSLSPKAAGDLVLDGLKWPQADGSANQVLKTDGSAQLAWTTVLANVSEDTSPTLGGSLDVNGNEITGAVHLHSPGNVTIELGDTGGTNKLSITDSSAVEVASWDSNGDIAAVDIACTSITTTGSVDVNDLAINGGTAMTAVLDEDNMASDSATALATQQSIKAYVDSQPGGDWTLITTVTTTSGTSKTVTSGLGTTYEEYMLVFDGVDGHSGDLDIAFSDNGGSSYAVTIQGVECSNSNTVASVSELELSNGNSSAANGYVTFTGNKTAAIKPFTAFGSPDRAFTSGILDTTSDIDAIQISTSFGPFSAGNVKIYGR